MYELYYNSIRCGRGAEKAVVGVETLKVSAGDEIEFAPTQALDGEEISAESSPAQFLG